MTTIIDKAVPGFDLVHTQVGDGLRNFEVIKSLSIVHRNDENAYDCLVTLVENAESSAAIILKCERLSEVSTNLHGMRKLYISGLQVFSVKNRGLEDQNWEISDYEDGNLMIRCREVSVSLR